MKIKQINESAQYEANSYYDKNLRGLEDSFKTDDVSELKDWVWDKLQQNYVKITNLQTGASKTLYSEEVDGCDDSSECLNDYLKDIITEGKCCGKKCKKELKEWYTAEQSVDRLLTQADLYNDDNPYYIDMGDYQDDEQERPVIVTFPNGISDSDYDKLHDVVNRRRPDWHVVDGDIHSNGNIASIYIYGVNKSQRNKDLFADDDDDGDYSIDNDRNDERDEYERSYYYYESLQNRKINKSVLRKRLRESSENKTVFTYIDPEDRDWKFAEAEVERLCKKYPECVYQVHGSKFNKEFYGGDKNLINTIKNCKGDLFKCLKEKTGKEYWIDNCRSDDLSYYEISYIPRDFDPKANRAYAYIPDLLTNSHMEFVDDMGNHYFLSQMAMRTKNYRAELKDVLSELSGIPADKISLNDKHGAFTEPENESKRCGRKLKKELKEDFNDEAISAIRIFSSKLLAKVYPEWEHIELKIANLMHGLDNNVKLMPAGYDDRPYLHLYNVNNTEENAEAFEHVFNIDVNKIAPEETKIYRFPNLDVAIEKSKLGDKMAANFYVKK